MGGRRVGGLGRVGPYTMVERLGRGGMGDVYLAVGRRGVKVAVKMLRDPIGDDPDARLRLEREVLALRRVESPYVARVLDADLSGYRPYLVMEHIEGETLLDAVRRSGPLAGGNLIELACGLATAITIIHAAGVIHRDVKPANVVLGPDGPVLIDFGIAQVADATRVTMTGTFLGTPGYSAPEVFAEEPVEEPSDVHSWAATVAFAATGRPTFGRGSVEAQMYAVLNGRADLAGVPGSLLPLIRAALNREPAKRPTAALLADRLSRLARATSPAASAGGRVRRDEQQPGGRGKEEPPGVRGESPGAHGAPGEDAGRARAQESSDRDMLEPPGEALRARVEAADAAGDTAVTPVPRKKPSMPRRPVRPSVPGERVRVRRAPGDGAEPPGTAEVAVERRGRADGAERRAKAGGAEGRSRDEDRARRARAEVKESPLVASAVRGSVSSPPGSAVLVVLAMVAVPCVVASVIWPLATFMITAAFCVLARAWWSGHWLVRNRRSSRVRGTLRVVSFPFTLAGSALTAMLWPGLPASAIAASAFWVAAGGRMEAGWWTEPVPMTVAGVVFAVVCGGIVGREIERVGVRVPDLRREGLRALSVLGGFVALCAAAVRVLAWIIPHAL